MTVERAIAARTEEEWSVSVRYYTKWLRWHRDDVAKPKELRGYLWPYLPPGATRASILDAGCGCAPVVGTEHPMVAITLVSCDMMADKYRALLDGAGIVLPQYVEAQDLEDLSYEDDSFDIVHCSNALDHTYDPLAALAEFARVCRPGGWLYLRHPRNSGEKQLYKGLHRWNIHELGPGNALLWRPGERYDFRALLPGSWTDRRTDIPAEGHKGRQVITVWQKPRRAA